MASEVVRLFREHFESLTPTTSGFSSVLSAYTGTGVQPYVLDEAAFVAAEANEVFAIALMDNLKHLSAFKQCRDRLLPYVLGMKGMCQFFGVLVLR